MSRYIDLDKAIPIAIQAVVDVVGHGISQVDAVRIAEKLEDASTADVVEVVRCKDCVNYCGFEHCKNGICDKDVVSKRAVYPNDFCSYGERREE